MAQSNYTPIQLYRTSTAAAAPTAGNLAAGELAINLTDEKLYFKNAAGTVKLLAANVTPVANGGTGTSTAFTAGSVVFAGASGVYTQDNANLFWDDTNNRLGIGTATPAYRLDVAGTVNTTQALRFSASHFEGGATYSISNYLTNMTFNVPTGSGFGWAINGGDTMLINSSGNVGIGTASPVGRLDAVSASATGNIINARNTSTSQFFVGGVGLHNGASANNSGVTIGTGVRDADGTDSFFTINKTTSAGSFVAELAYYDLSADFWRFNTSNTERMRITAPGYLEATYSDKVVALGNSGTATTINLDQGNVFTATLTGNCTFTLAGSNANSSRGSSFTLILTNDATAGRTVAWAGGTFRFPGGAAALSRTTTANAVDIWVFFTPDNGTTYYGNISMKNMIA